MADDFVHRSADRLLVAPVADRAGVAAEFEVGVERECVEFLGRHAHGDPFADDAQHFGGRGTGVGQFGTGHGVTVNPGKKKIDISDRPNSEIDRFTPEGKYLETISLPKGSFPCDTSYDGQYMTIGALHGPDRTKGAPIYILEKDKVVSTIMAKEELGLVNFQHIHNATMRKVGKKLYIIAQAWNPGDFAILEQVD